MSIGLHISISFLLMWTALMLGDALSTGYPITNGLGHGIFFGTMAAIFLLPISIATGHLLIALAKKIVTIPEKIATLVEYHLHIPFSVVFLANGFHTYVNDGYLRFVSDERPSSLKIEAREIQSAMGFRRWMFALTIDPEEIGMVTSRYEYKREALTEDEVQEALQKYLRTYKGDTVPFKDQKLVNLLSYAAPDLESPLSTGFRQDVFITDPPRYILVFGSAD